MSNLDFLGPVQPIDPEAFLRLLRFHLSGVEVTQSIQYYHSSQHLTDPADRGADNAVTLVANKPAWVRVYVRSGFNRGPIPGVTGTLQVERRFFGNVGTPDPTYPAYEPYDPANTPQASIGEYGLDISNGNIMSTIDLQREARRQEQQPG